MFYIIPHVHIRCTWLYCERLAHGDWALVASHSTMGWFAGQIQDGLWRWWWSCAPRLVVVVQWSWLPLNHLIVQGLEMDAEAQWGWYLTICCAGSQGKKECSTFPNAYTCSASNRNSVVPRSSCQFQNVLRHHVLCETVLRIQQGTTNKSSRVAVL